MEGVRAYAFRGGLSLICLLAMGWAALPPGADPGWPLPDRIERAVTGAATWYSGMPPGSGPDWETAARDVPGGEPAKGARLMRDHGCGACHRIPGIRGARGRFGPALDRVAQGRGYVAGVVANRPGGLVRWIVEPTTLSPGTAMPDLGVTEDEARHMAAYLYAVGGR
jgi:cytochrome c2